MRDRTGQYVSVRLVVPVQRASLRVDSADVREPRLSRAAGFDQEAGGELRTPHATVEGSVGMLNRS